MLRGSGVPGTPSVWADILYEGPVPAELGSEATRAERARFIAARGYAGFEEALEKGRAWDAGVESSPGYDEVVT